MLSPDFKSYEPLTQLNPALKPFWDWAFHQEPETSQVKSSSSHQPEASQDSFQLQPMPLFEPEHQADLLLPVDDYFRPTTLADFLILEDDDDSPSNSGSLGLCPPPGPKSPSGQAAKRLKGADTLLADQDHSETTILGMLHPLSELERERQKVREDLKNALQATQDLFHDAKPLTPFEKRQLAFRLKKELLLQDYCQGQRKPQFLADKYEVATRTVLAWVRGWRKEQAEIRNNWPTLEGVTRKPRTQRAKPARQFDEVDSLESSFLRYLENNDRFFTPKSSQRSKNPFADFLPPESWGGF